MSDANGTAPVAAPRITVVIPTYQRSLMLADSLASVLAQRRPADEIVVVSDGSDSEAASVADTAGVTYVEIPHGGVARARNAGIEAATGDWVCFLDDDDLYHPDYLAEVHAYLAVHPNAEALNTEYWTFAATPGPRVDLVGSGREDLVETARTAVPQTDMEYLKIEGRSYELLLGGLRGNLSSSAVLRSRLLEAGGFPAGFVCAEDWTMFVNVARYTEWHLIEHRLVFMRIHAGSNTRNGTALSGLHTLTAFRDVWQDKSRPIPHHRPLDAYRWDYRFMLRSGLDLALRTRDWAAYRQMLRTAGILLPHPTDRLRAMVPSSLLRR